MEWLAKDIWTGSYEEDDIMRLTIAMELSFNLPHGRCCCHGERPLSGVDFAAVQKIGII